MNKENFLEQLASNFEFDPIDDGDDNETFEKFKKVITQLDELRRQVRIMTSDLQKNNVSLPYNSLLDMQELLKAERGMGNVLNNTFNITDETVWHIKPPLFQGIYSED